jgi:hypothetical protein
MRNGKKLALVFMAALIAGLAASCASTGQYMPLTQGETVIGTVQSTFTVQSSFFSLKSVKDAVNTQAYIHLMEAAGQKYSGSIDIRDIVWVTGKSVDNQNTEISATGKVVQTN